MGFVAFAALLRMFRRKSEKTPDPLFRLYFLRVPENRIVPDATVNGIVVRPAKEASRFEAMIVNWSCASSRPD